jgi:hypothetical protein
MAGKIGFVMFTAKISSSSVSEGRFTVVIEGCRNPEAGDSAAKQRHFRFCEADAIRPGAVTEGTRWCDEGARLVRYNG